MKVYRSSRSRVIWQILKVQFHLWVIRNNEKAGFIWIIGQVAIPIFGGCPTVQIVVKVIIKSHKTVNEKP